MCDPLSALAASAAAFQLAGQGFSLASNILTLASRIRDAPQIMEATAIQVQLSAEALERLADALEDCKDIVTDDYVEGVLYIIEKCREIYHKMREKISRHKNEETGEWERRIMWIFKTSPDLNKLNVELQGWKDVLHLVISFSNYAQTFRELQQKPSRDTAVRLQLKSNSIVNNARTSRYRASDKHYKPRETVGDISILKGYRVNSNGDVKSERGEVIGRLSEGEPTQVQNKEINGKGEILDDDGKVIGKVEVIPQKSEEPLPSVEEAKEQVSSGFKRYFHKESCGSLRLYPHYDDDDSSDESPLLPEKPHPNEPKHKRQNEPENIGPPPENPPLERPSRRRTFRHLFSRQSREKKNGRKDIGHPPEDPPQ